MCGRAAQSRRAVRTGADLLAGAAAGSTPKTTPASSSSSSAGTGGGGPGPSAAASGGGDDFDRQNLSPGMRGIVFRRIPPAGDGDGDGEISCSEKLWGLVTRGGTRASPLPEGSTKHFSGLMFNARSDTLYDKRTFRDLALKGNTCVMAVDGFYEWKAPDKNVLGGGGGKQPYYVHRHDGLPLLLAGLWTSVPTGRENGFDGKPEMLHTFTLLTTDACPKLRWLHSRMPVIIWDLVLALEWLRSPSRELVRRMAAAASTDHTGTAWHPVTKRMSSVQYQGSDCSKAVKLKRIPSVKSFFGRPCAVKSMEGDMEVLRERGATHPTGGTGGAGVGRKRDAPVAPSVSPKKARVVVTGDQSPPPTGSLPQGGVGKGPLARKRGQITSFFAPRNAGGQAINPYQKSDGK